MGRYIWEVLPQGGLAARSGATGQLATSLRILFQIGEAAKLPWRAWGRRQGLRGAPPGSSTGK
jgi:hypothetical protein